MADQKISQLPAAATPLAGTEVLPIVQSGTTVKVSAADVTAGRSVSAANLVVTSATVPANGVYLPSANSLGFGTDTTERMRIDSTGNVGIGTASPTSELDVFKTKTGVVKVSVGNNVGAANDAARFNLNYNGTSIGSYGYVWDGGAFNNVLDYFSNLALTQQGTERMRIDSAGRLLVGQTGPINNGTIDVLGTSRQAIVARVTDNVNSVFQGFNSAATATSQIDGSGNGYFAGNVGIGTSSPANKLVVEGGGNTQVSIVKAGTTGYLALGANSATVSQISAFRSDSPFVGNLALNPDGGDVGIGTSSPNGKFNISAPGVGQISYFFGGTSVNYTDVDTNVFRNAAGSEAMRIDSSGNLLVGKTASSGGVAGFEASAAGFASTASGTFAGWMNRTTSDGEILRFNRDAVQVGSVSVTTTATTYNTSSDYRLKDIDGPIANSGAYIDALKPVQGSWKADGSRFIGLLAHEVQEVSETQIATGEKDGEEMQAMDYSAPEIIANLIAEIQSLRARVAQLEGN